MRNYVQSDDIIDYVAGSNLSAGDVVVVNATTLLLGVVVDDIANGKTGAVMIKGTFDLPCLGTDTPAQGDALYWDSGNSRLTTTATANTFAGLAAAAKASGPAVVRILLNVRLS